MDGSGCQLLGDSVSVEPEARTHFLKGERSRDSTGTFSLEKCLPVALNPAPDTEHGWAGTEVRGAYATVRAPAEPPWAWDTTQSLTLRKDVSNVDLKAASKIQRSPPSVVPPFQRQEVKVQPILLHLGKNIPICLRPRATGASLSWRTLDYVPISVMYISPRRLGHL